MSSPRISVNKLGEFLTTASPVRRRGIVRDQKKPNPSVVPLYRHAIEPIEAYLNNGGNNVEVVLGAIERLKTKNAATEWAAGDNANTAAALELFLEVADKLVVDGIAYTKGDNAPPKLSISGVEISVRPDFLLTFNRRGQEHVGALKLHFIKGSDHALGEDGQEYVSTLLHEWIKTYGPAGCKPSHKHCFSLDVFRQTLIPAPASYARRMNDIAAACAEIAMMWPTLPL